MGIRIRALRLLGLNKHYDVSFSRDQRVRALSTIAGEISTGKTSILEFIDYCLGARRHPTHQEIQRRVRGVMLEIEADGDIYVIERPLFARERVAWVHHCRMGGISLPHSKSRRPLDPPGHPNSLSTFLLDQCGLAGISLKEAPTKAASGADLLSFRDVMWLCYLENRQLDNEELLHERNFMEHLKLEQVVSIMFGVHSDREVQLSDQLKSLGERRKVLEAEIASIESFLQEHEIPERGQLRGQVADIKQEQASDESRLEALSVSMSARSGFADELRQSYAKLSADSRKAAAVVRDRETLLRRMMPLHGQYVEDERKLLFYDEAQRLFDPLRVSVCPACLQSLPSPAGINDGSCSLCGQPVVPDGDVLDVKAELSAVKARRRAIEQYISEVEEALKEAKVSYDLANAAETDAQRRLDALVADSIAPFVNERDMLVRQVEGHRSRLKSVNEQLSWRDGVDRRVWEKVRLEQEIEKVRRELESLQSDRPSRDRVVSALSDRFRTILEDFGFPKLLDPEPPFIDASFTPYVRGNVYREIGSRGALTLISLAWTLAIFEMATKNGHSHPGFLMIDSPQKNLMPRADHSDDAADEFRNPAIVARVWRHIHKWSQGEGSDYQVIVVDNAPPIEVEDSVVVRYSGRPELPPYGLIEDETS